MAGEAACLRSEQSPVGFDPAEFAGCFPGLVARLLRVAGAHYRLAAVSAAAVVHSGSKRRVVVSKR